MRDRYLMLLLMLVLAVTVGAYVVARPALMNPHSCPVPPASSEACP